MIGACIDLSGRWLFQEFKELGYAGGCSEVTDYLRKIRPDKLRGFECHFKTEPGEQGRANSGKLKSDDLAVASSGRRRTRLPSPEYSPLEFFCAFRPNMGHPFPILKGTT